MYELIGKRFGRLLVLRRTEDRWAHRFWTCLCDCGKEVVVRGESLYRGETKSCGCLRDEMSGARVAKHRDTGSPEFTAWARMRQRCVNPKRPDYRNYGGRGITVCERWNSFENFLADMGRKPSPAHSLDRINNEGNYEPSNCQWATLLQQNSNRRRKYIGPLLRSGNFWSRTRGRPLIRKLQEKTP